MPEVDSQSGSDTLAGGPAPDALAGLYHMSNTAGAGTQEYVAINPVAIWAAFFGIASVLVVMSNVLLVVPLIGAVCSVVALSQIRSSNGTQTGRGLATLGLIFAVALGGGKLGYDLFTNLRTSADESRISQLLHEMGQNVVSGKYDQAYAGFTDAFKQRVSRAEFERDFRDFSTLAGAGTFQGIEWNRQVIIMEEKPDTDIVNGMAMALFQYSGSSEPRRVVVAFEKSGGVWRPDNVESIFPTKKKQQ